MKESALINGECLDIKDAKISIFDRGFLFGDSIYEVFKTQNSIPLYFDAHWERFLESCRLISLDLPFDKEQLFSSVKKIFKFSEIASQEDIYIRMRFTRGKGLDLDIASASDPSLIIFTKKLPSWNEQFYSRGIKLWLGDVLRNSTRSLSPSIKGGNYLNNILGLTDAKNHQCDDVLFYNHDGLITECSNSNFFVIHDHQIITAPANHGLLKGITRKVLLEEINIDSYEFVEAEIDDALLEQSREAFITSTTRGVMPVGSIRSDAFEKEYYVSSDSVVRVIQKLYEEQVELHLKEFSSLDLSE